MAIEVKINNVSIQYPQIGDTEWGNNATNFAIQTATAFNAIGLSNGTTVDLPGTLDVTGNTTLDSNLAVGGTLGVTGNVAINTNKFNITASSGNTTIAGIILNSNGSALNPSYSFSNDTDNGMYYIGTNNYGLSAGGIKVCDISSIGLLNGSIGVDYRNLIKRTSGQLTRLASPTTSSSATSTTHVSSGIGFAYTASNINSRLIIRLQLSTRTEFSGSTAGSNRNSFFRTYIDTSSVPILGVSPPGTSTQINSNENYIGSTSNDGISSYYNGSFLNHTFEVNPSSLSARYYYLSFRTDSANCQITFFTATGSYYALYTVEEYL